MSANITSPLSSHFSTQRDFSYILLCHWETSLNSLENGKKNSNRLQLVLYLGIIDMFSSSFAKDFQNVQFSCVLCIYDNNKNHMDQIRQPVELNQNPQFYQEKTLE